MKKFAFPENSCKISRNLKIKMNTKFPPNVKKLAKETVEDITFGLPGMKKHFKILPKGSAEQIDFEKIQNAAVRLTQKIGDAEKIRNAHDTKDTEDEARV